MSATHREGRSRLRRNLTEPASTHGDVAYVRSRNQIDHRYETIRWDDCEVSQRIDREAAPVRAADVSGEDHGWRERRRCEDSRGPRAGELLAAPRASGIARPEDLGRVEARRNEWAWQRWKRLRRRRRFTGNVAAWYRPLLDGK
jgi:hypothetical protein